MKLSKQSMCVLLVAIAKLNKRSLQCVFKTQNMSDKIQHESGFTFITHDFEIKVIGDDFEKSSYRFYKEGLKFYDKIEKELNAASKLNSSKECTLEYAVGKYHITGVASDLIHYASGGFSAGCYEITISFDEKERIYKVRLGFLYRLTYPLYDGMERVVVNRNGYVPQLINSEL